jgi:hypothetical protein
MSEIQKLLKDIGCLKFKNKKVFKGLLHNIFIVDNRYSKAK